jgi:hypothetical protein
MVKIYKKEGRVFRVDILIGSVETFYQELKSNLLFLLPHRNFMLSQRRASKR